MNITMQDVSESLVSADSCLGPKVSSKTVESDGSAVARESIGAVSTQQTPHANRKFQPLRFATGLLSTASGVALILGVGFRIIETQGIGDDFAMPLVASCVLTGVMVLGGGFGVMVTSSSGFDEEEFDRLTVAGHISTVCHSEFSDDGYAEDHDAEQSAA